MILLYIIYGIIVGWTTNTIIREIYNHYTTKFITGKITANRISETEIKIHGIIQNRNRSINTNDIVNPISIILPNTTKWTKHENKAEHARIDKTSPQKIEIHPDCFIQKREKIYFEGTATSETKISPKKLLKDTQFYCRIANIIGIKKKIKRAIQ